MEAMRLAEDDARARLAAHDHGILCTVHAERGVDAVPVVYAVDDGYVGVPIDQVKPKASSRLQRERNLEAGSAGHAAGRALGPRRLVATLVGARRAAVAGRRRRRRGAHSPSVLARRYPQYRDQPFTRVLVLRIIRVTGWAAAS